MQTLKLADDLFPSLLDGKKQLTIRRGKRDIDLGPLIFESVSGNENVEVVIREIRYVRIYSVDREICIKDGFKNWTDFYEGMKKYYPDLTTDETCTIIFFKYGN